MTSIYSGMMRVKLVKIMLKSNYASDIIKSSKSYSERGFIVEAMYDILIRFGMVDIFPRSACQYLTGNMNTASLHNMQSLETYLSETKVISGNSGGASDITLYDRKNEKHIFISSKYPKDGDEKAKSVDYYGIDEIVSNAANHSESYPNYDVYLIVPNKQVVLDAVKRANKSSKGITKFMTEDHILDNTDLERYFKQFKREVFNIQFDQYDSMFGSQKESLQLRFHQRVVIFKTRKLVASGETKILWGHKCRSGKTYMAGAIISALKYDLKGLNVMVITPAPSETLPQFKQDLFERFSNFKGFNIIQLNGKNISSLKFQNNTNNIIIVSKQLLQRYVGDSRIKSICKLKLDLIIYDENHFGGTTDCSKEIVANYTTPKTVQIYMTATFRKPRVEWGIKPSCELMWDLEDEQLCKARDVKALIDRHGSIAKRLLCDKKSSEDLLKVYDKMPDLHMITNMFQPERYAKIRESLNDNSPYGISFDTLLELDKKKQCANSAEVSMYLRYISGSDEESDFPQPKKATSIFRSMRNTCKKYGSRPVFTQLWFLPPNNIDDTSKALKRVMLEDAVLKKYEIICINSKSKLCSDVKTTIDVHYKIAMRDNKRGLIILAGGMLSLGITIPHCDAVFLLNNTISSDKVYQQMYRSMSEADGKSVGFVVDMNIGRVLNTCVTYNVRGQKLNTEDQIRYVIKHNLMNLDDDYFGTRDRDVEKVVSTLMEYWRSDPINSFKTLLMNLENEVINLSSSDQSMINKSLLVSKSGKSVVVTIEQDDELAQEAPTGKTRGDPIENSNESSETDSSDDEGEEDLPEISVSRDLLPFLVPFLCFLTLNDGNSDIGSMLHRIKTTPSLLAVFEDQSFVWWNRKGLVELFEKLAARYIDHNGVANNVSLRIKMELKSLIDEPEKLLEFIDSCLKPKETEKKRFGEVFTPMKLVNEMLDKLPKRVWSDKSLKWLDPANGMGNYPIAVYLRLMKGLSEEIPSKSKRKKHILENMLYMCELNSKNVHMCRQILDAGNQYKLNLHCGDFLEFDSKKVFGVKKFDIVMGNPPYQSGTIGVRKGGYGGRALWEIFVQTVLDRDLKKDGYLVFVHPSNWRKPEHKMWEVFTSRQIIHLDIHGEKEGIKVFRASTRYDWYVLQNKECNKETTIHDEEGKTHKIDLREWSFLPNYMYRELSKIIVQKNGCEVIYSRTLYGTDKKNMSKIKHKKFTTKVIHSMTQKGIGYWYTNDTTKGHFKEPKVVLSFGRHQYPYNDYKGEYGMSQIVYGLPIKNKSEGDKIVSAINSDAFKKIILATKWNTFYTEWRMFKYFKKDFYKQFQSKSIKKVDISDSDDDKEVPNKKRGKMVSGKAKRSPTRSVTSKRSD